MINTPIDSENIKKIQLPDSKLIQVKDSYKAYLDAREEEFAKSRKYWIAGVDMANDTICVGLKDFFKKEMVRNLEDALEVQGYDHVKIATFYKDVGFKGKFHGKIPMWVLALFGMGFPFVRTGLTTLYTKRSYDFLDGVGNICNATLGTLLIDTMHPLAFPIRMFAIPFITEPLRKILDIYNT